MKCVCKQCGAEFELSNQEIQYFKSKGLSLPKRCKACREDNKNKKYNNNDKHVYEPYTAPKKNNKLLYCVALLLIFIIAGLSYKLFINNPNNNAIDNNTISDTTTSDSDSSELLVNQPTLDVHEEDALVNIEDSSSEQENVDETVDLEEEYSQDTEQSPEVTSQTDSTQITEDNIETDEEVVTELPKVIQKKGFRNKDRLNEHYEKHGIDMGFSSAKEYEEAAKAVVNNPNALHKTEKEDGDDVYYVQETNEFVVVAKNGGYIRTYFKPDSGIKYYNKQ